MIKSFSLSFCLVGAFCVSSFALQDAPSRRIDFRDGSTLSVSVPHAELVWKNIAKDGQITERKIPFSEIQQISLVTEPSTARVSKIRNLLTQLGSEDYHKRLEAQILLVQTGKEFEPIIDQYSPEDEETKWRIAKVKEHLQDVNGPVNADSTFDVIILKENKGKLDGELDLEGLTVKYGDTVIPIERSSVASITDKPLQADFALSNSAGGGTRQQEYPDASGTMPPGMIFVDFERLPNGKPNSGNLDVSKAYVDQGVMFQTSIADSYVGTQMYTFGREGQYSIATAEPTYQGVITISFCVPGNELFAAGTKYVGFNVSHVNPEGTWFEAYDPQGQLITKFTTDESGMDYLGFRSEVPIAKVVVRPNPQVDEDYAIDDLFFERPVALLESGNPEYFSVVTRKGERLQANAARIEGGQLVLKDLSFGAPEVSLSLEDLWVLVPSVKQQKKFELDAMSNSCYCLLKDGSVVLADLAKMRLSRGSSPELDPKQLVACWGIESQLANPPKYQVKESNAVVVEDGKYFDLQSFKFGSEWLESESIGQLAKKSASQSEEKTGIDLSESTYVKSPCVYFQMPSEISAKAGAVYTYDGERYFIGDGLYSIEVQEKGVALNKGSNAKSLDWSEIKSLRFPSK